MNLHRQALMDKPSVLFRLWCPICGAPATILQPLTEHHIVPRADGGLHGPTIRLCGDGTTGCHGKAEDKRLHFKWDENADWWACIETDAPAVGVS